MLLRSDLIPRSLLVLGSALCFSLSAHCQDSTPENLPQPDDQPANMRKPVQVFILMGQSNMLGFGKVQALAGTVKDKQRFTHLMDDGGKWTQRKDVRNVRVMFANGKMKTFTNDWLTVSGKNFGPEIGFGHIMGHVLDAPVLVLKSCIGNRALGWDLLPPGSESYEHNGKTIPGYQGSKDPSKRPKEWYAGKQYDDDTDCVRRVLADLGKYYPGAQRYEIAGFVWWQGHKDQRAEWAERYEKNFVQLIKALRQDFNAPGAPFVCATIGFGGTGMSGHARTVAEAQLAVANPRRHPKFRGNVKTVDARPFWRGGGAHYGGNPETYMEVGNGLGWAMAELLENATPGAAVRRLVPEDQLDGSLKQVLQALVAEKFSQAEQGLKPYVTSATSKDARQMEFATKLQDYLQGQVDETVAELQSLRDSGDLYALKAGLSRGDNRFSGVSAYDEATQPWTAFLSTDASAAEIALGAKFAATRARIAKSKASVAFARLHAFETENPESFYAGRAREEKAAITARVQKTIDEIEACGARGDVFGKHSAAQQVKIEFRRIPAFDKAHAAWAQELRDTETQRAFNLGKAYAKVFDDLVTLRSKQRQVAAKNGKIRSKRARAKADEKAKLYFKNKLKPFARKLEKLAAAKGSDYYSDGAKTALEGYEKSGRTALTDPLADRKK